MQKRGGMGEDGGSGGSGAPPESSPELQRVVQVFWMTHTQGLRNSCFQLPIELDPSHDAVKVHGHCAEKSKNKNPFRQKCTNTVIVK